MRDYGALESAIHSLLGLRSTCWGGDHVKRVRANNNNEHETYNHSHSVPSLNFTSPHHSVRALNPTTHSQQDYNALDSIVHTVFGLG